MKVTVDDGRCRGHGVCITVCPEVFTLNDDGYAQARAGAIPVQFEEAVRDGIESCPEQSITAQYGSGPHGQHTVGRVVDARSESLAHPFDGRT